MTGDNTMRRQTIARNSLFGILAWLAPLIIGMIATPILIGRLGNNEFGLYSVVLGFLAYSFGFGTARVVTKFVAEYRASGDESKINDVLSATFWLNLSIGLIGSSILIFAAPFIVSEILLISEPQVETGIHAIYFASAAMLAGMIGQIFQFTLQGLHRFGIILLVTTINGSILGIGNILIVLNGYGVVALLGWNFVLAVFSGLVYLIAARSALPTMAIGLKFGADSIRSVSKYGSSIILYQVLANALYIFERIWVTRNFGTEVMAFYAVPMLLATYLQSFLSSFSSTLFPVMNELLDAPARQIELYKRGSKMIAAFVAFAVASSVGVGQIALTLWIDPVFAENARDFLIIHILSFGLTSILIMTWQLNEAYRAAGLNVLLGAIWAAVAIPLMIYAADDWGPKGIAISRLTGVAITVPMILYFEKKHFGQSLLKFWGGVVIRLGFSAGILMTGYYFVGRFDLGWIGLTASVAGSSLLYITALFATGYLKREDVSDFVSLLPFTNSSPSR
jgi:O-antigen/teichoic acid export membrane protein